VDLSEPKTVGEIVRDIQGAVQRMGVNNPHRRVLIDAGSALISMAKRLAPVEVEPQS
jgi:hypothetical protein